MTKKKVNRAKIAVVDGIARGWTAKQTAWEHKVDEKYLRATATAMKVSFPWERIGMPPKYSNEPVPVTTLFTRHRHTSKVASQKLCRVIGKMGKTDPLALELLQVVAFLRRRSLPEAWEKRIKLTK